MPQTECEISQLRVVFLDSETHGLFLRYVKIRIFRRIASGVCTLLVLD